MDRLDELISNDTRDLIEFYGSHLEFLKTCPVCILKSSVLKTVAVMIHSKLYFESEWQEYASEMGVTNNLHLATIQESARSTKELPMFITMRNALQRINGNVADIIKAFLNTKRYDVLSFLEPYIKKLMEMPDTEIKGFMNAELQLPSLRDRDFNLSPETVELNCDTVSSMFSTYTEQTEKATAELNTTLMTKNTTVEFNSIEKNSACINLTSEMKLHSSSKFSEFSQDESLPQETIIPSAPSEESISVLIQHTESDIEVARQLSVKLKNEGFASTTLCDMEMLIRMDPAGALSKIFREVDFIVPVVSEEFLQLIDPKFCADYDAMSNRTLYQLIINEYQYNGCVNFRVRPVLEPNMKRCGKLTNCFILNYSFQLWKEYEKLVRILKETKKILKHYPLKIKRIGS